MNVRNDSVNAAGRMKNGVTGKPLHSSKVMRPAGQPSGLVSGARASSLWFGVFDFQLVYRRQPVRRIPDGLWEPSRQVLLVAAK